MDELSRDGLRVLERLPELPGGPELLDLAAAREDVELVGGAARDLLLGRAPRELDVVVAGDASSFAHELALRLGLPGGGDAAERDPDGRSGIAVHERFGTALVRWEAGRIDIASRRTESYPAPGALPDVRAGTTEEDLRRRDFTVNAIAVLLGGSRKGELLTVPHALEDLAAARLRVLHERSFLDDPTRLLRLARYLARLRFEPEERTAELAEAALAAGALASVSGARIGTELRLALNEPDPVAALVTMDELGVMVALHPRLRLPERVARRALSLLGADGRGDLLLLGALLLSVIAPSGEDSQQVVLGLLDELNFTASDRDRAIRAAVLAPGLVQELQDAHAPSLLREAVHAATLEAVALAGALAEAQGLTKATTNARHWLQALCRVRLQITGDDLLAAGVPAGPEIGQRLELALRRKLDGELAEGPEAELSAAVEGL
jgi:tRNA nucleotidyltransferase (CCA-adding enzyme)